MKFKRTKILLIFLLLMLVFASCRSFKDLSTNEHTVSHLEQKSKEKDSVHVYVKDSVFVLIRGDTVFISKWHTQYRDRFRDRTDTLHRTDTLRQKQMITKTVKGPLNGWQNFQLWCGRIFLLLLLSYLIFRTLKHKFKSILNLF